MSEHPKTLRIVYFLMRYPVVSQTFIRREIEALCRQGHDITVWAIWDFREHHPERDKAVRGVRPEVRRFKKWQLPIEIVRALFRAVKCPASWARGIGLFFSHLPRHGEGWFMAFWGTFAGLALAGRLRREAFQWAHGAWATAPATTAWMLAGLRVVPGFSFGAHAYDVFRHGGDPFLPEKLRRAGMVHTTTMQTARHLHAIRPEARVVLSRRGLVGLPPLRSAEPAGPPWKVLTVARLVEKKGIPYQLQTLARLKGEALPVELHIAGEGPLRSMLEQLTKDLKLEDRVVFHGALPPETVQDLYAGAHIFWHTGIVDSEGDRDGLPNVLPEAMSHGLPVITSPEPGACEAVTHGVNGLIVDPRETAALASALTRLCDDAELRAKLGRAGRRWVETHFLVDQNAAILAEGFRGLVHD